jgi:exosortase E/protease (VPEID-CTERM system)
MPSAHRFSMRLTFLALLFTAELLPITLWLDGASLDGSQGLGALLHDWGALALRMVIASVVAFLVLGEMPRAGVKADMGEISWPLLGVHGVAMGAFVLMSSIVYRGHPANLAVLAWFLTGVGAIAAAACAFIPASAWMQRARAMRDLLVFAPVAALVGCVLGNYARVLWQPLARATFAIVAVLIHPFLTQMVADPAKAVIGSSRFSVEIAPQCSGYEGIGLVLAVTSAWLWFLRRQCRFPNALLLIPIGVAAVWLLNAVRIAALILIGNAGAPAIATGGFHSQAGWIAFSLVSLGVCWSARRIPWFTRTAVAAPAGSPAPSVSATTSVDDVAAYLAPFLAIMAASLAARAASSGFEWLYVLRVAAAAGALWYFRRSYRNIEWRFGAGALLMGTIVFAMWVALDGFIAIAPAAAPDEFTHASFAARACWITIRVIGAVVTVPIAEELAFRGFLLRRLVSADFTSVSTRAFSWIPFLVSSVAFGIMHGNRWIAGTLAGMIYAYAMRRRGRIGDAIAAHGFTNALLAAWVLVTGNWQLW